MQRKDLVAVLREDPEPFPDWLQEDEPPFDRENFFGHRTIYYPGSGDDRDPALVCARAYSAHSFIYVDYGVPMSAVRNWVHGVGDHGFPGYRVEREDELTESVLQPDGCKMHVRPFEFPADYADWFDTEPFQLYVVLRRDHDCDESHGPERLAMLFIGGDGHVTYDALYCQQDNTPAPFLVVVQDHGMGGNYSGFERGGLLEGIAAERDVYPKRLLVGSADFNGASYKPWYGYTDTGTKPDRQAAGNPRKLYRRNEDCLARTRGMVKRLLLLEVHDILKGCGDDGMRMRDIADLVNERDRYRIRDRSPVTVREVYEICSERRGLLKRTGSRLWWTG